MQVGAVEGKGKEGQVSCLLYLGLLLPEAHLVLQYFTFTFPFAPYRSFLDHVFLYFDFAFDLCPQLAMSCGSV